MNAVSLKDINKEYSGHSIIPLLSLEILKEEFVSLLGPSGCGKTTLIRMIAGLEQPTRGLVKIGDETVFDSSRKISVVPEKRRVGMVFQNYALWPHLTVLENIIFPLKCQKLLKSEILERSQDILSQVKLAGLDGRYPNQLSGGQQQRVALARALVSRPRLLLLDEPLSNLDTHLREEMCELLILLRQKRPLTMIYVTHSHQEALRLSDRIAVLNQGKIEQIGSPQELLTAPRTDFVRDFMRSSE